MCARRLLEGITVVVAHFDAWPLAVRGRALHTCSFCSSSFAVVLADDRSTLSSP